MSLEKDATHIKRMVEAAPKKGLFKPATPEQISNRESPIQGNFSEILKALYAMGITSVRVEFAGSGDSGDIEGFTFYKGNEEVGDPSIQNGGATSSASDLLSSITEIISGDWYNNEGGQGNIEIDTKTRKAVINVGYNYMETNEEVENVQL